MAKNIMIKLLTILLQFVTPEMFGAKGDARADDTAPLQKAADSVAKTGRTLYLANKYRITKGIDFRREGYQLTFKVIGDHVFCGNAMGSQIIADFKKGFAINIQRGKGVIIEGVYLTGKYKNPTQNIFTTPYDQYGDSTCSDSRYEPYVAIAVDWYHNPSGTVSGSTGVTIRDVTISNFTGGIIYSPNGKTLNNEMNTIERVTFSNMKFGFAGCQAQEKLNVIRMIKAWNSIHTVFVFNKYGAQQPGQYKIEDVNIAGHVGNLINRYSGGYYGLKMSNVFAELLGSIGRWDGGSADEAAGMEINFAPPNITGVFPSGNVQGSNVRYKDCILRYYTNSSWPMMMIGNNSYDSTKAQPKYAPWITGLYVGTPTDYTLTLLKRDTIWRTGNNAVIKAVADSGSVIIFAAPTNGKWVGMAEVISKTETTCTVRFLSQAVLHGQRYNIYKYKSNNQ